MCYFSRTGWQVHGVYWNWLMFNTGNVFFFAWSFWLLELLWSIDAPTIIRVTTSKSESWIGQNITLKCKADGFPTPTLTWKNPDGVNLKKVTALQDTVNVTLETDKEFGNYTCMATNDVGGNSHTVEVKQLSKYHAWWIISSWINFQYASTWVQDLSFYFKRVQNSFWDRVALENNDQKLPYNGKLTIYHFNKVLKKMT